MRVLAILCLGLGHPCAADTLLAARTLRPQTVLQAQDLVRSNATVAGAVSDPLAAIGLETRIAIYAGRPVMRADLAAPAVVDRNDLVEIRYETNALRITDEGRALARAGLGERIRVMSLRSRSMLVGTVTGPGQVRVD